MTTTETQSRLLSKNNVGDTEEFESETHETAIVDPES